MEPHCRRGLVLEIYYSFTFQFLPYVDLGLSPGIIELQLMSRKSLKESFNKNYTGTLGCNHKHYVVVETSVDSNIVSAFGGLQVKVSSAQTSLLVIIQSSGILSWVEAPAHSTGNACGRAHHVNCYLSIEKTKGRINKKIHSCCIQAKKTND